MSTPTLEDFRKLRTWLQSIASQGLCPVSNHDPSTLKLAKNMGFIQLFGNSSNGQIIITAKGKAWLGGKIG